MIINPVYEGYEKVFIYLFLLTPYLVCTQVNIWHHFSGSQFAELIDKVNQDVLYLLRVHRLDIQRFAESFRMSWNIKFRNNSYMSFCAKANQGNKFLPGIIHTWFS